jgi:hypothetical protein
MSQPLYIKEMSRQLTTGFLEHLDEASTIETYQSSVQEYVFFITLCVR